MRSRKFKSKSETLRCLDRQQIRAKFEPAYKLAKRQDQVQTSLQGAGLLQAIRANWRETWRVEYYGHVEQAKVLSATGLPVTGAFYATPAVPKGFQCTSVQPVRQSGYNWDVLVEFATLIPPSGDPTNYNILLKRTVASREEVAYFDRLKLPIANTVGKKLSQQPKKTEYDEVITITWSTRVTPTWNNLEGKTNADAVSFRICGVSRTYSPGQMKCTGAPFTSNKTVATDAANAPIEKLTYDCEFTFQVRLPKWVWSAPNESYMGFNPAGVFGEFLSPKNAQPGQQLTPRAHPTFIDEDGYEIADGETPLKLPDDVYGQHTLGREWPEDGSFELEDRSPVSFSSILQPLNDPF